MNLNDIAQQTDWTFIQPYGTADTYIMCALMEAFRQRQGRTSVTVVVKESHKPIAEMFDRWIDRIVPVPDADLWQYVRRAPRVLAPKTPVVLHPHYLGDGRIDSLTTLEGFSDKDMYAHLLALPRGISLPLPELKEEWVSEAASIVQTAGLERDRTVILVPDANSYPTPNNEFWCSLSQRLHDRGWKVATNLWGNNNTPRLVPFPQSVGIKPSIGALMVLASSCGWVISTLTGSLAMLYMAQIPCKKTVVAVGPKRGQEQRYNDNFTLRHAYPYASQRKCDGFDYEAQEIEVTSDRDYEYAIRDIVGGHYANLMGERPSPLPMVPIFVPAAPGDIFDRISVLQIKRERIKDAEQLHYVKRELLHLESAIARAWPTATPAADAFIRLLKTENEIGWGGIEFVYDNLDKLHGVGIGLVMATTDAERMLNLCNKYRELRDSNKRRIALKKKANETFGSAIQEQKTY